MAIPKGFRRVLYEVFPKFRGIATPLRPQARFERNRRFAAALSARCGPLVRNDRKPVNNKLPQQKPGQQKLPG